MSKIATALVAVATAAASLMLAARPAWASSAETWVSGTGNDGNDCLSPATPCRNIDAGLIRTGLSGTLHVLPGTYLSFVISHAVQIIADEGGAAITNSCGGDPLCAGVSVEAGANDVIRIRGITVNQQGLSGAGIALVSGAALRIENCTLVKGSLGAFGLAIIPNAAAASGVPTSITVRDSAIDWSVSGNVLIAPTNNVAVNVVLDHVTTSGGLYGVKADNTSSGKIRVDARDSVANDNVNNGYLAAGTGANPIHFMIEHSTASGNGAYGAVATGAQAFMIATYATLIGNATGLAQLSGSTVAATGTNTINFNAANTAGTITAIPLH